MAMLRILCSRSSQAKATCDQKNTAPREELPTAESVSKYDGDVSNISLWWDETGENLTLGAQGRREEEMLDREEGREHGELSGKRSNEDGTESDDISEDSVDVDRPLVVRTQSQHQGQADTRHQDHQDLLQILPDTNITCESQYDNVPLTGKIHFLFKGQITYPSFHLLKMICMI